MAGLRELDQHIDKNQFQSVYVFYGEEKGLITEYLLELKSKFTNIIETEKLEQVIEDTRYNSLFGGKKLYILKNLGLFEKKADDEFISFLVKMFKQKMHTVVFVEDKIDGTLKQTQALSDQMKIEFSPLKEEQLIVLVQGILEKHGKKMIKDVCRYFVDLCDYNYNNIMNEINKLVNFVEKKQIDADDVKHTTTRSTSSVVFDLVTYVVKQNYSRALDMYDNLILRKEQPLVILTLIYRQLKLLYQIKLLSAEGYKTIDIADACDSKPFIIEKNMGICNFDSKKLLNLMLKCDEYDYKIKTGAMKDVLAVKMLILFSSIRG